jgi:hypothetical protein
MLVFLMLITLYVLYSLYTLVHLRVLLNWATGRRNVPRCNLHLNILSARENFDERNTVRKTWGKTFPRYHFFVGNQSCTSQSTLLNPITCAPVRFATRSVSLEDLHLQSRLSSILEEEIKWEATEFHDVVLLPMTDSFHNLAQKLLLTWEWTIRNVPQSLHLSKTVPETTGIFSHLEQIGCLADSSIHPKCKSHDTDWALVTRTSV